MSKEARMSDATLDGFDGFDDRVEGREQEQFDRVIQGEKWKFTADGNWVNDSDEEISPEREVTVVEIARVVQKWVDNIPVETIFVPPGEKIPNIEKLNETCPKSEWNEDLNGKPKGPYQFQYVVYMIDQDMGKITYPTGTTGGHICVSEFRDKVVNTRKFRGERVYPVVTPSHAWMNTKFGGRNRPAFVIKRWICFGGSGGTAALEESASASRLSQPKTKQVPKETRIVPEVSVNEEMNDDISF